MTDSELPGDHRPSADLATLRKRSELMQETRSFFLQRDFIEVDTPILSADTVVDRYIDPMSLQVQLPGREKTVYLQTSPEFCMKRLLAAGAEAIFQLGKSFRQGECGRQHQPEFSMLEWYRTGDAYEEGRGLLDEFAQELLGLPPALQFSYRQVFCQFAELDPFSETDAFLQSWVRDRELESGSNELAGSNELDRDGILNVILSQWIEPRLAEQDSIIIYDWPASQSALARVRDAEDPVAERFELYVRGVELANGYHELTDPDELTRRNHSINQLRKKDGQSELPADSRLLAAMQKGMPNGCGTALGFDRLVMLAIGHDDIRKVIPFDFERA